MSGVKGTRADARGGSFSPPRVSPAEQSLRNMPSTCQSRLLNPGSSHLLMEEEKPSWAGPGSSALPLGAPSRAVDPSCPGVRATARSHPADPGSACQEPHSQHSRSLVATSGNQLNPTPTAGPPGAYHEGSCMLTGSCLGVRAILPTPSMPGDAGRARPHVVSLSRHSLLLQQSSHLRPLQPGTGSQVPARPGGRARCPPAPHNHLRDPRRSRTLGEGRDYTLANRTG